MFARVLQIETGAHIGQLSLKLLTEIWGRSYEVRISRYLAQPGKFFSEGLNLILTADNLTYDVLCAGASPYPGMSASQVFKFVNDGKKMEKPQHCTDDL